jgi:Tfp pilus assembly protein PilV
MKIIKDRGFGLMEVLVAMFFLMIMSLSMAKMLIAGLQFNNMANDETQILAIANDRMEQLKSMSFDHLGVPCVETNTTCGSLTTSVSDSSVTPNVPYFDYSDPLYMVRWTISLPTGSADTRRLTVRVLSKRIVSSGKQRELTIYFDRAKF